MQTDRHRQTDVWATRRESRWDHRSEAQVLVSREDGALLTQDHARWGAPGAPQDECRALSAPSWGRGRGRGGPLELRQERMERGGKGRGL